MTASGGIRGCVELVRLLAKPAAPAELVNALAEAMSTMIDS